MLRKVIYFTILFASLSAIIFLFIAENATENAEFYLEGETNELLRFRNNFPTTKNTAQVTLDFPISKLTCFGTRLKIHKDDTLIANFIPDSLSHFFTTRIKNLNHRELQLNLFDDEEIACLYNVYADRISVDSLSEDQRYNLSFIFFDKNKERELWSFTMNEDATELFMVGFQREIMEVDDRTILNRSTISGYFNTDSLWPLNSSLGYLDFRGLPFGAEASEDNDEVKIINSIQILPKLNLRTTEDTVEFAVYVSEIKLINFDGEIYIDGKKLQLKKSRLNISNISQVGHLDVTADPNKFSIKLRGNSSKVVLNGQGIVETYGAKFSRSNPILLYVIIALISSFLISLFLTRGRIVSSWLSSHKKY